MAPLSVTAAKPAVQHRLSGSRGLEWPSLPWTDLNVNFGLQLKVPTTEKPTVTVNFRKLLLNRCQKEFEKDKDDDEVFEKKQKEMDEAATVRDCIASHTLYSHQPSPTTRQRSGHD